MSRIFLLFTLLLAACGGAGAGPGQSADGDDGRSDTDPEVDLDADDLAQGPTLARGDLTSAVDHKRYRAKAPPQTEFQATDPIIYLVGRLKRVPTDGTIEVRWFLDEEPKPLLISEVQGSDSYQFIASFEPTRGKKEKKFIRGSYTARVYVEDSEVGARSFVIRDQEIEEKGARVKRVRLSRKVNRKMKAIKPTNRFPEATKKVYVSFNLRGIDRGEAVEIRWSRGAEQFHSEDLASVGDQRYSAHIESMMGLPAGDYRVEILVADAVSATRKFMIGKVVEGTLVDTVAVGLELGPDNMPVERMSTFKRGVTVIQCGLRFLELPPDALIEIDWVEIQEGDDEEVDLLRFTSRGQFSAGGSGTMGAAWEPTHRLEPGSYKVVVKINGEAQNEARFEIE